MHLEYQRLLKKMPDLEARLNSLPGRVFTGRQHPSPGTQVVFFCYQFPAALSPQGIAQGEDLAGFTRWYLYNLADGKIEEEPSDIWRVIRCGTDTPRHRSMAEQTLSEIRVKLEHHITNSYLKRMNAPMGVKPKLKAWMELS